MTVIIIGAGVAGLTCACELVDRGVSVEIYERSDDLGESACSWFAGGMLAPWCERESAEQTVVDMGEQAISWWLSHVQSIWKRGSLVLSMQRDLSEIKRFGRLTENHQTLNSEQIAALEPDLGSRFEQALFFKNEAHLHPRQALRELQSYLIEKGVNINFSSHVEHADFNSDHIIDCRGYAAKDQLSELRGVKGEMLILKNSELNLKRPVRLLHPRYPLYVVPREDGLFMLGATMIENDDRNRISVLSMLELLSTAYALHPGFGEAEVVEIGVDVRPAFGNNLPSIRRSGNVIYINGLFRHGFLLGPAMARQAADAVEHRDVYMELELCA